MQAHTAYVAQAAAVQAPRPPENVAMPTLYRAALGSQHAERYLVFFQRQDDAGRTLPGWNAAAAFFTLGWMVFRQLWAPALVYVAALEGVALLLFALGHQWLALPLPILGGVALAFFGAACVLPGLYGDAAMHAEVRKKITRALSASANLPQAAELLARQAPPRRRLAWVVGVHVALAIAALSLWLAFPASFRPDSGIGVASQQTPVPAAPTSSAAATAAAPTSTSIAAAPSSASDETPEALSSAATMASAPAPLPPSSTAVPAPAAAPLPGAAERTAPASSVATTSSAARPSRSEPMNRTTTRPSAVAVGTARAKASAAAAPAEPPRRQLYINAGLFGDADNARRAHAMLREAGLPASTTQVKSSSGRTLTRVRAGPFASTSEANAAVAQVQLLGLEAAPAQK
ncbi:MULTISPECIES: SPOR domain-containing protein [unclassified Acidovorax]|uniref:SPOR domain-containing protein n=1 Tax=unclassified Acidovorax TaxID=2684926 RepID=UPI002882F510|nr:MULTISPECIES: SPOR domain-containing protein [unclassified Acidovorax]